MAVHAVAVPGGDHPRGLPLLRPEAGAAADGAQEADGAEGAPGRLQRVPGALQRVPLLEGAGRRREHTVLLRVQLQERAQPGLPEQALGRGVVVLLLEDRGAAGHGVLRPEEEAVAGDWGAARDGRLGLVGKRFGTWLSDIIIKEII